jgi:hypothetical protein
MVKELSSPKLAYPRKYFQQFFKDDVENSPKRKVIFAKKADYKIKEDIN